MPNYYEAIGLPIQTTQELGEFALRAAKLATLLPVKDGHYLQWTDGSGAELWMQSNNRGEIFGMQPHFAGTSAVRVGLERIVKREDGSPFDSALYAWANASEEKPQEGDYPFAFDLPNFLTYPRLTLPVTATAQIAAFAHELTVYESEEAYDEAQEGELKFASKSFIPSGLFTAEMPQAYGLFTGHVLQSERKINEFTQRPFYWASVDTLGGIFDVVVSTELISETPAIGAVIKGAFWLSGTLLAYLYRLLASRSCGLLCAATIKPSGVCFES